MKRSYSFRGRGENQSLFVTKVSLRDVGRVRNKREGGGGFNATNIWLLRENRGGGMGDNHHIGTLCVCVCVASSWSVVSMSLGHTSHLPFCPSHSSQQQQLPLLPFPYTPLSHLTPTSRPAKGLESCHTHIHLRLVVYRLLLMGDGVKGKWECKKF